MGGSSFRHKQTLTIRPGAVRNETAGLIIRSINFRKVPLPPLLYLAFCNCGIFATNKNLQNQAQVR